MVAPVVSIDAVNTMVREQFAGSGCVCVELGDDFAVAAYDVEPQSIRPGGFVSVPIQFALVDVALWFLTFVALQQIEPMASTAELSIRYWRLSG